MKIEVVLVVKNVDLGDESSRALRASMRPLLWASQDGIVTVTHTADHANLLDEVIQISNEIQDAIPSSKVVRWFDDFVGCAQIARRVGVNTETVRLWSRGLRGPGNFPTPRGRLGLGENLSPFWTWAEVSEWLRVELFIETEERLPTQLEIAQINAELQIPSYVAQNTSYVAANLAPVINLDTHRSLRMEAVFAQSPVAPQIGVSR